MPCRRQSGPTVDLAVQWQVGKHIECRKVATAGCHAELSVYGFLRRRSKLAARQPRTSQFQAAERAAMRLSKLAAWGREDGRARLCVDRRCACSLPASVDAEHCCTRSLAAPPLAAPTVQAHSHEIDSGTSCKDTGMHHAFDSWRHVNVSWCLRLFEYGARATDGHNQVLQLRNRFWCLNLSPRASEFSTKLLYFSQGSDDFIAHVRFSLEDLNRLGQLAGRVGERERERERESEPFWLKCVHFVVGGLCCPLGLGGEVAGLTWTVPPGEPVELFPATLESHAVAVSIKWPL